MTPNSQTVNPGDSGEYTVRVTNTGSDPVTVNLQASNEPGEDCNGFSSTIGQIPGQIEAGSSEETTMNVTVGQTVEADTACDTTVTATITAVIGAPAAETGVAIIGNIETSIKLTRKNAARLERDAPLPRLSMIRGERLSIKSLSFHV